MEAAGTSDIYQGLRGFVRRPFAPFSEEESDGYVTFQMLHHPACKNKTSTSNRAEGVCPCLFKPVYGPVIVSPKKRARARSEWYLMSQLAS
jgi:hypothetical protein